MKNTILTICILSVMTLTALAQNQFPSPRYGTTTVKYNDTSIYIYGGVIQEASKSISQQLTNEVWYYNASNCTFTKVNPLGDELPGMYACSPVCDPQTGKIYFLGGLRTAADNAFYSFDPQAFQVSKKTQQPYSQRSGMSGEFIGSGKFLFSGGRLANGTASSAAYVFNAAQLTITQIADIPQGTALYGHNTISDTVNNKAYIFGGLNGSGNNNFSCYEYNTQTNSWGFGPSIQNYPQNEWTAYAGYGSTLTPNEIFIAGGQKYSTAKSTNSIAFSTNLYTITVNNGNLTAQLITNNLPPMIGGSAWCSLGSNDDTVFYFFGGINSITTTGDTTITNNFYRFNQTTSQIQQYDTTQQTWGGIVSSINDAEFKTSVELTVFPNPTTDKVSFALQTKETIKNIKIFNQNGQLIQQISNPTETQINFTHKTSGLYFIRIDTEKNYYLGKVIKQ
mgnify:FL=1